MLNFIREKFIQSGKWKDALKILLALVLMGVVLSQTSLTEIIALRHRLSWTWLVGSFLLLAATTLLKTLEYWALLGGRTSYRDTLKIVIIQNALTNFVTNSAGIASYLAMFQMDQNVKVRKSGAVFILTKAGDILSMGLFLLVSATAVWSRVAVLHEVTIFILVAVAAGLAVFWTTVFLRQTFVSFVRRVLAFLRIDRFSLVQKGTAALESLAGQDSATVRRTLIVGTSTSLLYMTATMLYGYSRVQTFQVPLDFWAIIFVASLMQFISIIPLQVFGGLGVTEFSLVYFYGLFGITEDIPAILVALRVLFYLFNLVLLAYIPMDALLHKEKIGASEQ